MTPRYAILLLALLSAPCAMTGARAASATDPLPAAGLPAPAAPAAPLAWKDLPANQQELLHAYAKNWDTLPPARQQALARGAHRWLSMDPQERTQARERFQNWQKLPEERRELIRQRWERFQQLDPESKALVRENFNAYMHLPAGKRRALRERWLAATPEQRERMLERMRERRAHPHRTAPEAGTHEGAGPP